MHDEKISFIVYLLANAMLNLFIGGITYIIFILANNNASARWIGIMVCNCIVSLAYICFGLNDFNEVKAFKGKVLNVLLLILVLSVIITETICVGYQVISTDSHDAVFRASACMANIVWSSLYYYLVEEKLIYITVKEEKQNGSETN